MVLIINISYVQIKSRSYVFVFLVLMRSKQKVCLQYIYFLVCCFHHFSFVIMSLVDLAHGKHRHVPYRDSRLTFLLQVRKWKLLIEDNSIVLVPHLRFQLTMTWNAGFTRWKLKNNNNCKCQPIHLVCLTINFSFW